MKNHSTFFNRVSFFILAFFLFMMCFFHIGDALGETHG